MMKRKSTLILITACFFVFVFGGILTLSNPGFISGLFSSSPVEGSESNIVLVQYPLSRGEIVHTWRGDGSVISGEPDRYVEEIEVEYSSSSDFKMLKEKGEDVDANIPLYSIKGKNKSVSYNSKLMNVETYKEDGYRYAKITLLNYSKLYIKVDVDSGQINARKINYATKVYIVYEKNEIQSEISDIGIEVGDSNTIEVHVAIPVRMLPGTKVSVVFELGTEPDGLYVPLAAVYKNGDDYYADVLVNEFEKTVEPRKLKVGEIFDLKEGSLDIKYVEILDGVKESETIVVQEVDQQGDLIKQNLTK